MEDYIGMELEEVKKILHEKNMCYEVIEYNDKKMTEWDNTRVLRVTENEGKLKLVVCNFLFKR